MAGSIRVGGGEFTTTTTSSTNSPAVTVQSGIVAGDVLVLAVLNSSNQTVNSWPSGFTEITPASTESTLASTMQVATKTASGSESGSFTMGATGFDVFTILSFTVTGVSTTLAASANAGTSSPTYGATMTITGGSVNTTAANNFVVWLGIAQSTSTPGVTTYTQPSSFTNRITQTLATNRYGLILADFVDPTAHTTNFSGSIQFSASGSICAHSSTLVFTPTGGGGSPPVLAAGQYDNRLSNFTHLRM